jgi:hypothetical protein
MDLQNDYTTGDNRYPKNRQQTLHLLDKYSKSTVPDTTLTEGASFAQKAGRRKTSKFNSGKAKPMTKSQEKRHHRSVLGFIHGRRTVVRKNGNRQIEEPEAKKASSDELGIT